MIETIFTQLSLKAAIKTWRKDATNAAEAEMKQLHWRNSFVPKLYNDLSPKQGEIKGRTFAGGNKQRGYINPEDASSPTVLTETVILTSMIDAMEEREVAIVDIPNAFIQTEVTDKKRE